MKFEYQFFGVKVSGTKSFVHCSRDVPAVKGIVLLSLQVLSAVSTELCIVCCGGSCLEVIKATNKAPSQKAGIQYTISMSPLNIEKLIHKPSFSVMGKIDIFSR